MCVFFFERFVVSWHGNLMGCRLLVFFPSKDTAKVPKMTIDQEFWNKNMYKLMTIYIKQNMSSKGAFAASKIIL